MIKKIICKFLLVLTLILTSSCLTKALWGDKHYKESVEQFFVSEDGTYFVLIGKEYHYVLNENSGVLREIFNLKNKAAFTIIPEKSHLKLLSNNTISGYITLEAEPVLMPQDEVIKLQRKGFRTNTDGIFSIKLNLSGRRYISKYLGAKAPSAIDTNLEFKIYYDSNDKNLAKDVGKVAITPIAVTLDAVILIGKVVLYTY